MSTTVPPPAAQPSEQAKDIARDFLRLRFPASEAVMLDDQAKVLKLSRAVARAHYAAMGMELPEEPEEMIHVGDQITIQQPAAGETAADAKTAAAPPPAAKTAASWAKTLAPWLLGPAVGAGAALGIDYLTGDTPAPPAAETQPGKWLEYQIERWDLDTP